MRQPSLQPSSNPAKTFPGSTTLNGHCKQKYFSTIARYSDVVSTPFPTWPWLEIPVISGAAQACPKPQVTRFGWRCVSFGSPGQQRASAYSFVTRRCQLRGPESTGGLVAWFGVPGLTDGMRYNESLLNPEQEMTSQIASGRGISLPLCVCMALIAKKQVQSRVGSSKFHTSLDLAGKA